MGNVGRGLLKGLAGQIFGPFYTAFTQYKDGKLVNDFNDAYTSRTKHANTTWNQFEGRLNQAVFIVDQIGSLAGWLALITGLIGFGFPPILAAAVPLGMISLAANIFTGAIRFFLAIKDAYVWYNATSGSAQAQQAKENFKGNFMGVLKSLVGILAGGVANEVGQARWGGEGQGGSFGSGIIPTAAEGSNLFKAAGAAIGNTTGAIGGSIMDSANEAVSPPSLQPMLLSHVQRLALSVQRATTVQREPTSTPASEPALTDVLGKASELAVKVKGDMAQEKAATAAQASEASAARGPLAAANSKLSSAAGQNGLDAQAARVKNSVEAAEADSDAKAARGEKPSDQDVAKAKEVNTKLDEAEAQTGERSEKPTLEEKPTGILSRIGNAIKGWWKRAKAFFGRVFARFGNVIRRIKAKAFELVAKVMGVGAPIIEAQQGVSQGAAMAGPATTAAVVSQAKSDEIIATADEVAAESTKVQNAHQG